MQYKIPSMIAILAVCANLAAAQADLSKKVDAVDEYLERLAKLGFSGAVHISQGENTLLASGYSMANREAARPWNTQTISTIGSITKQFTGAAILALVEEGKLTLHEPITEHFPSVPADKSGITLHQLLTHSSGIVDLEGVGDFDAVERDEFIRRAMEQELAFEPGSAYEYSNAGYSLLGAIIEQQTAMSYEEFVRERLFLPAGMRDTGYILANFDAKRLAQGYRNGEKWGTVVERDMAEDGPYWVLRANGGIHSSLDDMQRWARCLLEGRALTAESMELYWTPHVSEGFDDSFYGYGWVVMDLNGHRVITHNGGNGIHFADMAIVPEAELVMALQCNVIADFPIANQLLERMGAHILFGQELPRVPDRGQMGHEELAPFTGRYAYANGGELGISSESGELRIRPNDPVAFSLLLSTRSVDAQRAERLSARIDTIVSAWLAGDVEPLYEAYERRATRERLLASAASARQEWNESFGRITGHQVLGTAFRDARDVTLVRILCERGHVDRAYVWDREASEKLMGVSRRGLNPVLHVVPVVNGGFASWDGRTGASLAIRFEEGTSDGLEIVFGDADELRAKRVR